MRKKQAGTIPLMLTGLLALAVAFNGKARAAPPEAENLLSHDYGVMDPPACTNHLGETVYYVGASKAYFDYLGDALSQDVSLAYSTRSEPDGKNPVIVTDLDSLSHTPPQVQMQVSLHECFHHRLGHVGATISNKPAQLIAQNENAADCAAIKELRDEKKYTEEDVKIIETYTLFLAEQFGRELAARHGDSASVETETDFARKKIDHIWACFRSPS